MGLPCISAVKTIGIYHLHEENQQLHKQWLYVLNLNPADQAHFIFGLNFKATHHICCVLTRQKKITYFPVKTNCALLRRIALLEQHLQQIFSQLNKVKLNLFIYNTHSYFIISKKIIFYHFGDMLHQNFILWIIKVAFLKLSLFVQRI